MGHGVKSKGVMGSIPYTTLNGDTPVAWLRVIESYQAKTLSMIYQV